ncbi:hypothetical protein H5J25_03010 [Sphingomonas aliaeris]|uniref:Uncharacterized protein n=1 Tax=Sphingomonas aliaeris TaxID=2759526 RepID=A0A974NVP9_9SPHN|nr:hypothetical protein [Sphingomonas aliaeris]QQV77763.1 hypothetical protein H5J25_03010 [Sphingomonas aliaeris]
MTLLILMISLLVLSIATTYVVSEIRSERAKLRAGTSSLRETEEDSLPAAYIS